MTIDTQWSSMNVDFWAEIDGTEVECVQAIFTYEINKIPEAQFIAAVGRDVKSGSPSSAHSLAQTKLLTPVKLYADVTHKAGISDAIVPEGKHTVFEGYVTGVGMSRGVDSYRLAFSAIHWLSDLDFGSCLSELSHPGNPSDLSFGAAMTLEGPEFGGGSAAGSWHTSNLGADIITDASVSSDLWGDAIKPWLLKLSSLPFWDPALGDSDHEGKAAAALERIESDPALSLHLTDLSNAADVIARDISCTSLDVPNNPNSLAGMANTTFWDVIVGRLGPSYMFSVIPFPEKAKVVPFIEGLREHWTSEFSVEDYTFVARDIDYIDITNNLPRKLGAYWVYGSCLDAQFGADSAAGVAGQNRNRIKGGYPAPREAGLVMMRQVPRWLCEHYDTGIWGPCASGADGGIHTNAVAHPEKKGGDPRCGPDPDKVLESVAETGAGCDSGETMLEAFAHALFCNEMLKGRYGRITGPIRFDVCPGSTIKFEGVSEKYTPGPQPVGQTKFAHVQRVTYYLDAQNSRVGAAFDINSVRTETENEEDNTSVTCHPLYKNTWPGEELATPG